MRSSELHATTGPAPSGDAAGRLQRLQAFLDADPGNEALLAALCDEALERGDAKVVNRCTDAARALQLRTADWTFRTARAAMLAGDLPRARGLFAQAKAEGWPAWLAEHDGACAAWLAGDAEACLRIVAPWLEPAGRSTLAPEALEGFALLWLRALHAAGEIDQGWAWAQGFARDTPLGRAAGAAALLAIDADRFDEAERLAREALACDEHQPEAQLASATVTLGRGEAEAAIAMLQRLLARHPQDGRSRSLLGLAQMSRGLMAEARRSLQEATGALPRHVGSWYALGWACLSGGDHEAALQAFRQAVAIDGGVAESHGAVGLVLLLAGDADAAAHHLEVAARLEPGNATGRLARLVQRGERLSPQRCAELAARWLDRPGLFGASMGRDVKQVLERRQ